MLVKEKKKCGVRIELGHKVVDDEDEDDYFLMLKSDKAYTIGRSFDFADLIFKDPRVSKQHCQILFDCSLKKLYLLNGVLLFDSSNCCVVNQFRDRLILEGNYNERNDVNCCDCVYEFKAPLNGVFVDGVKVDEGKVVELCNGNVVMLVCTNLNGVCEVKSSIGFVVRKVALIDEIVLSGFDEVRIERPRLDRSSLPGKVNKRVFALQVSDSESSKFEVFKRAKSLKALCNKILHSDDPVTFIRRFLPSYNCMINGNKSSFLELDSNTRSSQNVGVLKRGLFETFSGKDIRGLGDTVGFGEKTVFSLPNGCTGAGVSSVDNNKKIKYSEPFSIDIDRNISISCEAVDQHGCREKVLETPGKNFYLNELRGMCQSSSEQDKVVSLSELLHPVDTILRIFIATFTSDAEWFLSYCDIPSHLPITLACHNTENCWSEDISKRFCKPYPNFPNLVLVYPPFPESIAFGKDRKNRGIGCHHPKFIVLQREDSMRVVITSANLVAKQWHSVTNTVWWQDFPRRKHADCRSLFREFKDNLNHDFRLDFAAQLSGFMATLLTDVPSEAFWIVELTKYDFSRATGYLVPSIPGIHSYRSLSTDLPTYEFKCNKMFLGSIEACVVGISYLFRTRTDSNGMRLKKLATYLGKSAERGRGISEIILKREKNIPCDPNAVSVVIPNPMDSSKRDFVQLGFLPRAVAKWVSPLWDMGFFKFCGHVCPKEALSVAFGENSLKVQLILHVSQGPNFLDMTKLMEPQHVIAFCTLVASLQRCTGLWRMEEVLNQYNWPEPLESDFIYGSSSIGTSVGTQFIAAFSAASGKRSQHMFDSEESDPEWGCWTVADELKKPSIKIIFPTIDRVKSAICGILPSRRLLCFSEKTWQGLKMVNILHDAVPNPLERVGHPMHVKVARRRFKSKTDGTSFGWIYNGSHNMSAAAWGRPISTQSGGPNDRRHMRLHVCNYELGIIFVFPQPKTSERSSNNTQKMDDIRLPFEVPARRYGPTDRPATMQAMSEALTEQGRVLEHALVEEVPDENDEFVENHVGVHEEEDDKVYADILWHQVDSSPRC